jgi:hypothetical protein
MNLDARHLVCASRRKEAPLKPLDGGASTQWWRAHRRGAQGGATGTLSQPLLIGRSETLAAVRERERRRNRMRLGLREAVERGFVRPKISRSRRIEMDGSRTLDRVSAQAGRSFPGPGPGCSLERGTR